MYSLGYEVIAVLETLRYDRTCLSWLEILAGGLAKALIAFLDGKYRHCSDLISFASIIYTRLDQWLLSHCMILLTNCLLVVLTKSTAVALTALVLTPTHGYIKRHIFYQE